MSLNTYDRLDTCAEAYVGKYSHHLLHTESANSVGKEVKRVIKSSFEGHFYLFFSPLPTRISVSYSGISELKRNPM